MQPSSFTTGEQDLHSLSSDFGADDVERKLQDAQRIAVGLFPERKERWEHQIGIVRWQLDPIINTIEYVREILSVGQMSDGRLVSAEVRERMNKRLLDERGNVRRELSELFARMRREETEGAVRISLELPDVHRHDLTVLTVQKVGELTPELRSEITKLIEMFNMEGVGVKFVVTRNADSLHVVALFDPETFHDYIARKYLKIGQTFEGAGKIRKGSHDRDPAVVYFDSDTCWDAYRFNGPDDPTLRAELLATIEEEWTALMKRASLSHA